MKNEIINFGSFSKIVLKNANGDVVGQAIVDSEDIEAVSKHKWHLINSGYVIGYDDTNQTKFLLHNFLMGVKDGFVVDHINGNKLDNRRANLRHFTQSENVLTAKISSRNKTGKKGVSLITKPGSRAKYRAQIIVNGELHRLGTYTDFREAVKARQEAELKYLGFILDF